MGLVPVKSDELKMPGVLRDDAQLREISRNTTTTTTNTNTTTNTTTTTITVTTQHGVSKISVRRSGVSFSAYLKSKLPTHTYSHIHRTLIVD
ncbi:hypothetical protein M0802_006512 [Mischocyttarus mexicanus]|nr:hypothetical protein M0802_006512 [Mischocyttarus mexicanus]